MTFYFDMDGVLADFEGFVKSNGIPYPSLTNRKPTDDDAMWAGIRRIPHFYYHLKPIEGTLKIFNRLRKIHPCEILTAIPKPKREIENAAEDKREWIRKYLGANVKVHIVYWEEKKNFCTGKDCILIDDLPKNISAWEENGGSGILFKNPEELTEQIVEIFKKGL